MQSTGSGAVLTSACAGLMENDAADIYLEVAQEQVIVVQAKINLNSTSNGKGFCICIQVFNRWGVIGSCFHLQCYLIFVEHYICSSTRAGFGYGLTTNCFRGACILTLYLYIASHNGVLICKEFLVMMIMLWQE